MIISSWRPVQVLPQTRRQELLTTKIIVHFSKLRNGVYIFCYSQWILF